MATQKRTKKQKQTKLAKVANKKAATKKKQAKNASVKKAAVKKKAPPKKSNARRKRPEITTVPFDQTERRLRSTGSAPEDLHGSSEIEEADSESVDELLEEGNAFEAEVVKGVEDAERDIEGPVRTHEVPEDDIPQEYLDDEE